MVAGMWKEILARKFVSVTLLWIQIKGLLKIKGW
jgi:hypothetical protein